MNKRDRLESEIQPILANVNLWAYDLEKDMTAYKFRDSETINQDSIARHAVNFCNQIAEAAGLDGFTVYRSHPKSENEIQGICMSLPRHLTNETEDQWWKRYLEISDDIKTLQLKNEAKGDPIAAQFAFGFPDYIDFFVEDREPLKKSQYGTEYIWLTIKNVSELPEQLQKRTKKYNTTANMSMHLQSARATDGTSFLIVIQTIRFIDLNTSNLRKQEALVSDEILVKHLLTKHLELFMDLARFLEVRQQSSTQENLKLGPEAQAVVDEIDGYGSEPTVLVREAIGLSDLQKLFKQNELIISLLEKIAVKSYLPVILDGEERNLLVGN